jgi:hypothetical protein
MRVFHKLFIDKGESENDSESIQDTFSKVQKIFSTYTNDPLYYHLNLVFEYLRLEYLSHYGIFIEAEKHFDEINDAANNLMMNYSYYTFPSKFLILKIERALRLKTEGELYLENETMFGDYEIDTNDVPAAIIYSIYGSLSCYYTGRYEEAAKILQGLLNVGGIKNYALMQIEIKGLLALQYCLLNDIELLTQLLNSVQRLIRMAGADACENVSLLLKILKIASSEAKRDKPNKIRAVIPKLQSIKVNYFSPTKLIKMDEEFVSKLTDAAFLNIKS